MDKRNILLAIAAALTLCAVVIATMEPPETVAPAEAATQPPGVVTLAPDKPTATPAPAQQETEIPEDNASEIWSDDGTLRRIKPLDVDLDAETQWAIYEACEYDTGIFCLVMAIAEHESGFDPQTVGDNGQSLGMMQINTRWHTGRMEALGVTDLTDPVQCAIVAIDYLQELESRYGFEPLSHELLMGYNFGPGGAKKALAEGKTSTAYSREIMTVYQGYLEELEGEQ